MKALIFSPHLFAILCLLINLLSAIRYAIALNWWNATYWLAAFVLTFVVTFKPEMPR